MLNNYFKKCFNNSLPPLSFSDLDDLNIPNERDIDDILCTVDEVQHLLKSLDISKSNGPDGISARMLKETASSIAPSVTRLFNLVLETGSFPVCWKMSHIVPIPKPGDQSNPSNYRPISLLSILSKVFERHLHLIMTNYIAEKNLLSEKQWGFQARKGTVLPLLHATNDWFHTLDSGAEVCAVFFDFKKAFDSIPHRKLISILRSSGFNPALTRLICSYLTGRLQVVVVDGVSSQSVPVVSGVPQGSVLGPLLFLLYIDDITNIQLPCESNMVLYADDILLYRQISADDDYQHLQHCVNLLSSWCSRNHLTFNSNKCKCMVFSRRHSRAIKFPSLCLGSTPLELVHSYKYLGVTLTSDLSWSEHIQSICVKSKKLIGLLYRRFYGNADPATILILYCTLVRPHLEYACQVWSPYTQRDKDLLENVQKFALRMSFRQWNASYRELLNLCNISTLRERRLYLSLCLMYKITHFQVHFPPDIFIPKSPGTLRSTNILSSYVQPFARTNAYLHSYVPSTISSWNSLPTEVTNTQSLPSFKDFLSVYIL